MSSLRVASKSRPKMPFLPEKLALLGGGPSMLVSVWSPRGAVSPCIPALPDLDALAISASPFPAASTPCDGDLAQISLFSWAKMICEGETRERELY